VGWTLGKSSRYPAFQKRGNAGEVVSDTRNSAIPGMTQERLQITRRGRRRVENGERTTKNRKKHHSLLARGKGNGTEKETDQHKLKEKKFYRSKDRWLPKDDGKRGMTPEKKDEGGKVH